MCAVELDCGQRFVNWNVWIAQENGGKWDHRTEDCGQFGWLDGILWHATKIVFLISYQLFAKRWQGRKGGLTPHFNEMAIAILFCKPSFSVTLILQRGLFFSQDIIRLSGQRQTSGTRYSSSSKSNWFGDCRGRLFHINILKINRVYLEMDRPYEIEKGGLGSNEQLPGVWLVGGEGVLMVPS